MLRKLLKVVLVLVGIAIVGIAGLLIYVKSALPNVGDAPDLKVDATPQRIERGKYLANNVMVCVDCHSGRDWSTFSGPIIAGTEGEGGEVFDHKLGFPGSFIAKNITPGGIKDWTDGEVFRAITTGVSRDGRALFPIMPYPNFGQLDEEDILSVIAYIRTLPAKEHTIAPSSADFPMNFIINTIPQKAKLAPKPSPSDQIAYGKYIVTAASCGDCHTKFEKGKMVGEPFAGGREFVFPDGSVLRSANITPHAKGIGNWTPEVFLGKFKQYVDTSYVPSKVQPGGFQTMMPWTQYAHMDSTDLLAVYAYLKSIPPVDNYPEKFTPAKG